ncbi:hypothetical protein [Microvirga sp. KLBC 81]|uniref:hypothetical protein n=1 Tax=Microvirga sp. KLBC 81 TaxID=1862707 RepID=UPI0014020AF0|nr:hypothetical protein [Microvirga sp. KLBC 81]
MKSPKPQKRTTKALAAVPESPNPSERELSAIAADRQKLATLSRPVRVGVQRSAAGHLCIGAPHNDEGGMLDRLSAALGSNSSELALETLQGLIQITRADLSPEDRAMAVNGMLAIVSGVQPQNAMEGALAVQIAATHHVAMMLLARVGRAEHIPMLESNGNMAVKLLRISREHAEALAKLRRGGNQTVRVEHVHVHSGGQAIVGTVTHPGGRGTENKTDDQPHAPGAENADTRFLATEPVTSLWSQDAQRESVPVAGREGPDEVPDARRHEG